MKYLSQWPDSNNDLIDQGSPTGPTGTATLEHDILPTESQQRHLQDDDFNDLERQGREGSDRSEDPSSRLWTSMNGRLNPVTIVEKCQVPFGESVPVSPSFGLYQSLRTWLSRKEASQLCDVQSFDGALWEKATKLESKVSMLEPSMTPVHIPLQTAARESKDSEHAFSPSEDLSSSSDSHLRRTLPQGDLSSTSSLSILSQAAYPLSEDRESSRAHAGLEGDGNDTIRAAILSIVSDTSSWKDTSSSDEHDSHRSDASRSDSSDSSALDGCPFPLAEDADESSAQEFNSDDDDGDYSASSYASSCTETTLTPSTISVEGARALEIRWCQVEHAVIHPLMATLFTTLAVPHMECATFRSLQRLALNEVDGRIAVRLQSTLALHQKSYLMDCVLPPKLVVLGQGLEWCSDDDFEDWWDVKERFSNSYHHEYSYSY